MYIIGNGRLFTRDSERPYLPDGAVVTDGSLIAEVGTTAEMRGKYPHAEFIDAHSQLIMPAFINTHTHIYSGLARGLSINGYDPTNFYEILDGMWWKLDRELSVTTVFDHHASYKEIPGSLFAIADCAKEMGIRSCLCYEVSDRDGQEKCDQAIKENAAFIKYCRDDPDPMLAAMFGMHALFTISDKTFEKCVEANNGMTGYHIHICEGLNDVEDSRDDRLLDRGALELVVAVGGIVFLIIGKAVVKRQRLILLAAFDDRDRRRGRPVDVLVFVGKAGIRRGVDVIKRQLAVGLGDHLFEQVLCLNEVLSPAFELVLGHQDGDLRVLVQMVHVVHRVSLQRVGAVGGEIQLEIGETVDQKIGDNVDHHDDRRDDDHQRDRHAAVTRLARFQKRLDAL